MASNPDKAGHFVRTKWKKTVPIAEAIREKGLFGNQNSAAKPRAKKWQLTVERWVAAFHESL
ncbi:MAG: hypothetical protein AAGI53_13125 [Planctomycetota bacterium]